MKRCEWCGSKTQANRGKEGSLVCQKCRSRGYADELADARLADRLALDHAFATGCDDDMPCEHEVKP